MQKRTKFRNPVICEEEEQWQKTMELAEAMSAALADFGPKLGKLVETMAALEKHLRDHPQVLPGLTQK